MNKARSKKYCSLTITLKTKSQDLSVESLDRISKTMTYCLRINKGKASFHSDEIEKHIFKSRCPHNDIVEIELDT